MSHILSVTAQAKVNLLLRVLDRRVDGRHNLLSLVAFADVGDELVLSDWAPTPNNPHDFDRFITTINLNIEGNFAPLLQQSMNHRNDNLVIQALRSALNHGAKQIPTNVLLKKNLPLTAGLGGGSSDAAAILRTLKVLEPEAAAQCGADVPVCLTGQTSWMCGIGDELYPLNFSVRLPGLIVWPNVSMPTKQMFERLANTRTNDVRYNPSCGVQSEPRQACHADTNMAPLHKKCLSHGEIIELMDTLKSDFEPICCASSSSVANCLRQLRQATGVQSAQVSGSGSACIAVCESIDSATKAAVKIQADNPAWWVRHTTFGNAIEAAPPR